jgi:hypothetical protein
MFISGPRASSLGSETGTTSCMLLAGQGGDHLTSSMIYHSSTATCIPTAIVGGSTACFASSIQAGGFYANGTTTITSPFDTTRTKAYFDASNIDGATLTLISDSVGRTIRLAATTASTYSGKIDINTSEMNIGTNVSLPFSIYTNQCSRATISSNGAACFACELTAKTLGTNDLILNNLNYECANYVDGTRGSWLIQEGACDLFIINQISCKKYKFNLIEIE